MIFRGPGWKSAESRRNQRRRSRPKSERPHPQVRARILVEQPRHHESGDGPYAHGIRPRPGTRREDPRVVTLHADISGSIRITDFENKHPERNNRVFSVGIAEQNMMSVAAGLAREGLIPVTGTYGVFASGRAWDQILTTICYSNLNVKIAGAHGGISVGPDGATHQALEEISLTSILPNMNLVVPCDLVADEKSTEYSLLKLQGPCYLRFAREATPIVTKADTPYQFGVANVIRYRGAQPKFLDAFETVLGPAYKSENEQVAIIACGPMVPRQCVPHGC